MFYKENVWQGLKKETERSERNPIRLNITYSGSGQNELYNFLL